MQPPPAVRNDIRNKIAQFIQDHKNDGREEAEAQTFLNDFFAVFGVDRRQVATFEAMVELVGGQRGYIDLFWPGTILVEMKSRGKDLKEAYRQALNYTAHLPRQAGFPKYILVCDFWNWDLYDMENHAQKTSFTLEELPNYVSMFYYLAGYGNEDTAVQEAVNIRAAEALGKLHDQLKASGYIGHDLEVYLVRLLFLLFAEDTDIFERNAFRNYITHHTREDGSDLGGQLEQMFQVLNTHDDNRLQNINEDLKELPYVNGGLFAERIRIPAFTKEMRESILAAANLNWGEISPSIFGAMFQSVMDKKARLNLGAHYTSETNILNVIKPLFLDELLAEFHNILHLAGNNRKTALVNFQNKIASLKFLDPACGCGNFLIVTYRELRRLELEVLKTLHPKERRQLMLNVADLCKVNVAQFYGIEIEEFPAQIAQVGMWLTDHQMNTEVGKEFGQVFVRLPLEKSATIKHSKNGDEEGNALTTDWGEFVGEGLSYIIGNPPFRGARKMSKTQKHDLKNIYKGVDGAGELDYVTAWYKKAAEIMRNSNVRTALLSTNSIVQGQQVAILWRHLFENGVHIDFAYRTFKWRNDANGQAAVHCVIIGFSCGEEQEKKMLVSEDNTICYVQHINAYLYGWKDYYLNERRHPICDVPEMGIGNKAIDDGNYLFTEEEKDAFLMKEPAAAPYFHPWMGAKELINGNKRYCLWLGDLTPDVLQRLPECVKRSDAVARFRAASTSPQTRNLSKRPRRFHVENMPNTTYIIVPRHSSENRDIIPIAFVEPSVLASDATLIVPNASLYHFGVMTSRMHMAWVNTVCGRLEVSYRYSKELVYNNYPWPEPTDEQRDKIEDCAQAVLNARKKYANCSLATLYNPSTMPEELRKAHQKLDAAVEAAYNHDKSFTNDAERVRFLFDKNYEMLHPQNQGNGPAV